MVAAQKRNLEYYRPVHKNVYRLANSKQIRKQCLSNLGHICM
jgi:hypothetical protein